MAAALGCLFFLFELFADLTSSGGNDSSAEGSSPAPGVEVPSGASLVTILASMTCIALGAGALLLFLRWLKHRPARSGWVIFFGSVPAVVIVGLGIYLLVSATLKWSLPYGSVPDVNSQVNVGGMGPLELTVLVTIVLLVVLVVVTKPRLLIPLLVMLLVSVLLLGLLSSFGYRGLIPYGSAGQFLPAGGYAEQIDSLRQTGLPAFLGSSQEPDMGAVERTDEDSGSGDLQTGEAAAASNDGSPPQTARLPVTVATPEIMVEPPNPVTRGDTLMLEGTVSVAGQPIPNTPITVDGEQLGRTDANGNFAMPYQVPPGTPLGALPLGLAVPAWSGSSTVFAAIMSTTSLLLKPLEGMSLGRMVPVEAQLLDDQGVGVPDATIDCGDGVTGVTDSDGVANLVLMPSEGEDLSETLENCRFDGDESNLPVEASVSSDDGFNWRLWVGLSLAVVGGSVVAYLVVWRRRSIAALLRRAFGLRRRNSRAGEDDDHLPVATAEQLRVRGRMATHLEITLVKLAEDLPYIWGIGEQVQVNIMLTDDSGDGVTGQTVTAVINDSGQPVELTTDSAGRCHTSWTGTVPGTYRVVVDFAGGDRFLSASAHFEFEVVDFREDIVGRYNSSLQWIRERDPRISEQTTPREVEVMVVDSGMPVDHRAMEVVIARFEEADYSLHEIDRTRFEAMYRARRKIVGD